MSQPEGKATRQHMKDRACLDFYFIAFLFVGFFLIYVFFFFCSGLFFCLRSMQCTVVINLKGNYCFLG